MMRFLQTAARVLMIAAIAAFSLPLAASAASSDGVPMMLPVDPAPLVVETGAGEREFTVEVADEERERAAGLMFRTSMSDRHGMLFVFQETRDASFWMKNTPMPLDLVFIGEDGVVKAILRGEPFSTAPISPDAPVRA